MDNTEKTDLLVMRDLFVRCAGGAPVALEDHEFDRLFNYMRQAEVSVALDAAERIYRASSDPTRLVVTCAEAIVAAIHGRLPREASLWAMRCYDALQHDSVTEKARARGLYACGLAEENRSDSRRAERLYREAIMLAKRCGDVEQTIKTLCALGLVYYWQRRVLRSVLVLQSAVGLMEEHSYPIGYVTHSMHLATVYIQAGRHGEAEDVIRRVALHPNARIGQGRVHVLEALAHLAIAYRDFDRAEYHLHEARETYLSMNPRPRHLYAFLLRCWSKLHLARGRRNMAIETLDEAIRVADETNVRLASLLSDERDRLKGGR